MGITDYDEKEARLADERRLLSVGLSRAMRRLALIFDANHPSSLIKEMNTGLWINQTKLAQPVPRPPQLIAG